MQQRTILQASLIISAGLLLAACSSKTPEPRDRSADFPGTTPPAEVSQAVGEFTQFATTPDAENIYPNDINQLTFETSYTIDEIADFYREQHQELVERDITTIQEADTLNLVLDGDPQGALVIQAIRQDETTRRVTVRLEDI